jgi:pyruvate dehydrogenase E2 component (dihydrolipoamide acetyltransferase)
VSKGDELVDVESEKIASSVECAFDGILRRQMAQPGDMLPVGALLGVVANESDQDADIDAAVAEFVSGFKPLQSGVTDAGQQTEKVQIGNRTIRWLKLGHEQDTPAVLIHGFGGDLNNWLFNHADLTTERIVWALDLPGHGQSSKTLENGSLDELAQSVIDFMDYQHITSAHLVGHSLGGAIAMTIAARAPERVASLALIASASLGPEIDGAYIQGFVTANSRNTFKPLVSRLFTGLVSVNYRQLIEDLLKYKRLEGVQQALSQIATEAFDGNVQKHVMRDQLGAFGLKKMVIFGKKDRIIPAQHAMGLDPSVRIGILAGGHMVQMEAADEVNDLLKAFWQT